MKTINRILISSILFALISIASILGVISILFFSLVPERGKEMLDEGVFNAEEILGDFDAAKPRWDALSTKLNQYGYHLFVTEGHTVAFSGLDESQTKATDSLKELNLLKEDTLTGKASGVTFVAKPAGAYSLFALKGAVEDAKLAGFFQGYLAVSIAAIAVILLLSLFFTRRMAWRVLRPLKALSDGARRIENGDLSQPVNHRGRDEFAEVASAFNHMRESLLEERKKTAAYEAARIDLIAGISHDLRTPLTSVKGYVKGLRDGVANTPEKREQYLSIAYRKACDMDVLLQKLFYFSNLEAGRLPIAPVEGDLGTLAREFAESVGDELAEKGIRITAEVIAVPHPVWMDQEQMRRVLMNLTENAVKHAGAESLELRLSVWRERGMEHLLFADNGHGVPDEHLPCLFDRFWRGDESRRAGHGSGLGLHICQYIAEAHGGKIAAGNNGGLWIQLSLPCPKEKSA